MRVAYEQYMEVVSISQLTLTFSPATGLDTYNELNYHRLG